MFRSIAIVFLLALAIPAVRGADQALLNRAIVQDSGLTLQFSSPIIFRTERFHNPPRLVVNLYGVRIERARTEIEAFSAPWLLRTRTETILGDSIRLSLYLQNDASLNVYGSPPTSSLLITPKRLDREDLSGLASDEVRAPTPPESPAPVTPPPAVAEERIRIDGIDFEAGNDVCRLEITLSAPVKPEVFALRQPDRVVLDLPGSRITPPEQTVTVPANSLVHRLRTGVFDRSVARVVLDMKKKVDFRLSRDNGGSRVVLTLGNGIGSAGLIESPQEAPTTSTPLSTGIPPSTEAGSLAGRTIVIDAGHGGHDRGASGFGLIEKVVALDISRRLHSLLQNAGVTVQLTRGDDRYLPLPSRPAVANRIGADAFVAVHLNASGSPRHLWSGTETYFHRDDPIGREMATHVQNELVRAIGLPDRGVKSDTRVYKNLGFAVLRHAQVPAILVEVGYLNHPYDAGQLQNTEFRQRAAEGILAGLRSFFEGTRLTRARR